MIEIDGIKINIERKNIKHMYIHILPPNGNVKISASYSFSDKEIIDFATKKLPWIKKNISKIQNNYYTSPFKYVNDEKHLLWGKEYNLKLIPKSSFKKAFIKKDNLFLPVKANSSINDRQKELIEFYRAEIKLAIPSILKEAIQVVGKAPTEWRVKNMKTRWGSCNVDKKRIWLNLQLAKKSPECLEYVIYHELTHLHIASHNKEFHRLLNSFYPRSIEVEKLLKSSN